MNASPLIIAFSILGIALAVFNHIVDGLHI